MRKLQLALSAVALAFASMAQAEVIDFTADTAGNKANGFSSTGHPGVTFTDTLGADLVVGNFGVQSNGNALAAFGDDTSAIQMDFASAVDSLTVSFGNDDACCIAVGGLAMLSLFQGNVLVATATTVVNRNDIMDQTVSYSGLSFDRAVFQYMNNANQAANLIEVIDDITFNNVPEPGSLLLAGMAFAGLGLARRRAAKAQ